MKAFNFLDFLLLCSCTPATAISTIPDDDCVERIGQIIGFGVQRTKSAGVENVITIGSTNPNLLATWTALIGAADSTKVQFSPQIGGPVHDVGSPRTYGGNNDVPSGGTIILGNNSSTFTGSFLDVKQALIAVIKELRCEKNLSVFLISEHLNIWGLTDDPGTPTIFKGIPIESFWVTDKILGLYDAPDRNEVSWVFPPEWSDNLYSVTPSDFNPKVDLLK